MGTNGSTFMCSTKHMLGLTDGFCILFAVILRGAYCDILHDWQLSDIEVYADRMVPTTLDVLEALSNCTSDALCQQVSTVMTIPPSARKKKEYLIHWIVDHAPSDILEQLVANGNEIHLQRSQRNEERLQKR